MPSPSLAALLLPPSYCLCSATWPSPQSLTLTTLCVYASLPLSPLSVAPAVAGILVGQGVGYGFRNDIGGWRYTYGLSIPLAVVMTVGMISMPPSARWLALQVR